MGSAAVKLHSKDRQRDSLRPKPSNVDSAFRQQTQLRPGQLPPIHPGEIKNASLTGGDGSAVAPANGRTTSPTVVPPLKPKPIVQPDSSCLVSPKYSSRPGSRSGDQRLPYPGVRARKTSDPRQYAKRHGRFLEEGFELVSDPNGSTDESSVSQALAQAGRSNAVLGQNGGVQVMDGNLDANAEASSSWARDERISALLPFVGSDQLDGQSAKNIMEYLRSHVVDSRAHKQHWFNLSLNRDHLRRRSRGSSITWRPMEEIAVFDADIVIAAPTDIGASPQVPPPVVDLKPPVKGKRQKQQQLKTEVQQQQLLASIQQQKPPEDLNIPKSNVLTASEHVRMREILSDDLLHRDQLARKAIEDNAIFICARTPSRFR